MEAFNINVFEAKKDDRDIYTFKDSEGRIQTQSGDGIKGYQSMVRRTDDLFEYWKIYYSDGRLKKEGRKYHNEFRIGLWKGYDRDGTLERYENYDSPYGFDWEEMQSLCRAKGVSLFTKSTTISRKIVEYGPIWIVVQCRDDLKTEWVVDGISGEILEEKVIELDKK